VDWVKHTGTFDALRAKIVQTIRDQVWSRAVVRHILSGPVLNGMHGNRKLLMSSV
jgi:hypothetical protein